MRQRNEGPFIFGVLLVALSCAPAALGQSSTSAPPQSQAASNSQVGTGSPAKNQEHAAAPSSNAAGTASTNVPRMQSQEAPPQESLGEAARKARAQKTKAQPAKVYTEDKIAGLSGHGVSVVGDENSAGEGDSGSGGNSYAAPAGDGAGAGGRNEEQYWRAKAQAIHNQMAQIDDRIAKIQDEIQKYGAVSIDPSSGYRQNVIYVKDRNAQIQQLEEQKQKLQEQLDALADEGRKAGADSGWFR